MPVVGCEKYSLGSLSLSHIKFEKSMVIVAKCIALFGHDESEAAPNYLVEPLLTFFHSASATATSEGVSKSS
uniref:Uncharacterized protein n=1 Tax=Ditylenchus dipsaci TaxID=166011 RepID=A0A915CTA2_9BILA